MDIPFEIVVGTYEEFLLGYKFSKDAKKVILSQSFATHEHSGSIRCISVNGNFLATGAADDRIIVYDMKARKEHCMLTHHNSTINCLEFTNGHTHLISASADGVLTIVRVGNWQLEKLWEKPHKGSAVLSVAIHSTGKLALTLGSDYTLRTWNLVKGRQAYAINLTTKSEDAKSLEKIIWSSNDQWFALIGGFYTEIWSIDSGGIINFVKHKSRVTSCCWIEDECIVSGLENGQLCIFNAKTKEESIFEAHSKRVKCLKCYDKWLVSADSSGEIKVWTKNKFKLIASCSTGCRITCLDFVLMPQIKKEENEITVTSSTSVGQSSSDSDENAKKTRLKRNKNKRKQSMQGVVIETIEDSSAKVTHDKTIQEKNKSKPNKEASKKERKQNVAGKNSVSLKINSDSKNISKMKKKKLKV